ncbi:ligase-associated DNA damage response exonuclease [soil metagenome]
MLQWDDDLKVNGLELYLDCKRPRRLSFVSHAHSDHLALHGRSIATAQTAAFARHRIALPNVTCLALRQPMRLPELENVELELRPAGHVLGSAMLHVRTHEGSLLYTGDFKLRPSLTCETADLIEADTLIMESTYGRPIFRFPHWRDIADQLVDHCAGAIRAGRQPIVMGYSLGKAQEITRILTDAGLAVTQHGACFEMTRIYHECGQLVGAVRRYSPDDFHGPRALDLSERGVLVAPPNVARSAFVTKFDNPLRIACTGWALLPGAIYRQGVDIALPLSDHADFDELIELIDRVRPKKTFTHHGYPEFAEYLRSRGLNAQLARPDPQLSLFND